MSINRGTDREDVVWETTQATKKNGVMLLAATCLDSETVILDKASQTQKDKHHKILIICGI